MIKHRIAQYIEKEQLLTLQDKVLVTLSGGADSVALLRILLSLGYTCEAAHCNFHLRGEESNRDENFVEQLCHQQNIRLHANSFATEAYANNRKISIEMAARELRYQWFEALAKEHGHTAIAVAHHQDDSVETILLNLIRGTGIHGLLGIRPRNGIIVRPLLCVTQDEIIDHLQHIGQQYVTDSTNLQDEYTRNKIRLRLLPMMQEINPSVKEKIVQTGNYLSEVASVYEQSIEESKLRVRTTDGILIPALLSEPSPDALLFELLSPLGFNSSQIDDIMQSARSQQSGRQFIGNQGWRVIKNREHLIIYKEKENNAPAPPFKLSYEEVIYTPQFKINKDKHMAYFDADKLKDKFYIRKWQAGDAFVPFGMTGRKLVSDFMTDNKFSLLQKKNQWLLCCGENIVWVIGWRTDNRFRIDHSTRRIMIVKQLQ